MFGPSSRRISIRRTAGRVYRSLDSAAMTDSATPKNATAGVWKLHAEIERSLPEYLRDLERLVNIDCGSYTKEGVDEVGRFVAGFLRDQLGAEVELDANERLGDTVIGRIRSSVA